MKRLKGILKWSGIVLGGLVAIGLVANAGFVWTTNKQFEQRLAAIRAAGDPLTLGDLARPPIPPEKNAATYLRRAEAGMNSIHKEVRAVPDFWEDYANKEPMPAEIQKVLRAAFLAHADVIPLLEQAAACPDYVAQINLTASAQELSSNLVLCFSEFRSAARVLHFRIRLLADNRNFDDAVQSASTLLRLSRHCEHNPGLLSYLAAIPIQDMAISSAVLVLQNGPISKTNRGKLDEELARSEGMDGFIRALKGERAYCLTMHAELPYRGFWLINRGLWNQRLSAYLDKMQSVLVLLQGAVFYRQAEPSLDKEDLMALLRSGDIEIFLRQPFLGIPTAFWTATRDQAKIRSLRVLNALQAHAPAGDSHAPKLAELGLPAATITDPFTGEPLHVKRTPKGWMVYSVGPNFRDDGGTFDCQSNDNDDIGVGPKTPAAKPAEK